jgi:modification methylase
MQLGASLRGRAVWPCAQDAADRVWGSRRAPFEIARRAIETYSQPGDLVLDPLCDDPNLPVVLEAIRQQRHAAAVIGHDVGDLRELDKRVRAAHAGGAAGEALLLRGDPPELPRLLAEQAGSFLRRQRHLHPDLDVHPAGCADLIIVSLPALLLFGYRQEHSRQWHQCFSTLDVLDACARVLRPGGYLVSVTGSVEIAGRARDAGSETVAICSELGLRYWQHIVALLVPINGDELNTRRLRRRRRHVAQAGLPRIVHEDVHVFRKPTAAETARSAEARWTA